ncbi:MAG: penicillin-binding transpeptidase domain-containing protein [Solirubrobacterales bacterium]|nr:penicillin-binding transpeptidase domain-containing protein [Solirubrobacterales bacterium]
MGRTPTRQDRRKRLKTRALPLVALALVSFVAGAVKGCPGHPNRDAAESYLEAWARHDYSSMHEKLSTKSREAIPLDRFTKRYEKSEGIATMTSVAGDGDAEGDESEVRLPAAADTRAFGTVKQPLRFSFGSDGIAWENSLLFPGLKLGEELTRDTVMPGRTAILTRGGQPMAKGPAEAREHPLGDAMIDVTGVTGQADPEVSADLVPFGYDPGDPVGTSGLEFAFNERLGGTPGGTLFAKPFGSEEEGRGRVLGKGEPSRGKPLRTTINPDIQNAAVTALAGRSGGVAVLDVRRGYVVALAGQAYSLLQPPGSTMKIVTATAGLETGKVKMTDSFDYATAGAADGRLINNAHNEVCGGTFVESFAKSCNSVFAPLGMEIGEEEMTATAEKFGFNSPPALFDPEATELVDPPVPTIPQPGEYNNEVGVSAIGQGKVQATPLLMASVAQAIGNRGVSSPTPITLEPELQPDRKPTRVASRKVAAKVGDLMVAVVTSGTGAAGAIAGGQVAGKTGTAELGGPDKSEDAWFAAFAPADKPKYAIGVLIVDAPGDGGTVAAPIASSVLSTAIP